MQLLCGRSVFWVWMRFFQVILFSQFQLLDSLFNISELSREDFHIIINQITIITVITLRYVTWSVGNWRIIDACATEVLIQLLPRLMIYALIKFYYSFSVSLERKLKHSCAMRVWMISYYYCNFFNDYFPNLFIILYHRMINIFSLDIKSIRTSCSYDLS